MELDAFWDLIQSLPPRPREQDFARLTDELATRSPQDIAGFEDQLAALLYALDTEGHATAARARNDWFLYVRCAAVAAGPTVYRGVLADPARLRKLRHREAELLLTVARNAYERRTGMLWEHQPPVSYESGSNTAGWGYPAPLSPVAAAGLRPAPRLRHHLGLPPLPAMQFPDLPADLPDHTERSVTGHQILSDAGANVRLLLRAAADDLLGRFTHRRRH